MINAYRKYALMLVVFIHVHVYFMGYTEADAPHFLAVLYHKLFGFFHPASVLAAISGYLLFKEYTFYSGEHIVRHLREKYLRRVWSIFLPYFFWLTVLYLVNNVFIIFANKVNPSVIVSTGHDFSFLHYLRSFLWPELAVAKHLWYLNNLVIVFLVAPGLALLNRRLIFMPALLVVLVIYYYASGYGDYLLKYRFITFFLMGAFLGANKRFIQLVTRRIWIFIALGFAVMAFNEALRVLTSDDRLYLYINHVVVTIILFLVSYLIVRQINKRGPTLYNRSGHFFLYIIHPYMISAICKLLFLSGYVQVHNYWLLLLLIVSFTFLIVWLSDLIYETLHRRLGWVIHKVL